MKVCSTCRQTKDESEFFRDKSKKDGLKYQCKACTNKVHMKWKANNWDKICGYARSYRERYPEKYIAHCIVRYAVSIGFLKKEPCHCGEIIVDAHHEDYSKPLEVEWLCRLHHAGKHK